MYLRMYVCIAYEAVLYVCCVCVCEALINETFARLVNQFCAQFTPFTAVLVAVVINSGHLCCVFVRKNKKRTKKHIHI